MRWPEFCLMTLNYFKGTSGEKGIFKGIYTCSNGKQFTGNFENGKNIGFDIICN
jgi:hypothetical protein